MIISSFSAASTVDAGADITVTDTTRNKGTAQAGETTNYIYFSTDATLDPGDKLLGSRSVGVLETASASSDSTTVKIPETAAQPDLIVSALSAPTTAAAGDSITVTETTKNQHDAEAGTSKTKVYLSLDAKLDFGTDTRLGEGRDVPPLGPGISNGPNSSTVTIPPGTAPGTYYLIAVADA